MLLVAVLGPGCVPPSTNIGLPARQGHVAVRGAVGAGTDDASYFRNEIEPYDDEGLDAYRENQVRIRHGLGSVQGLGMPFAIGLRYGVTRHNDVGVEVGWGHANVNTRVDLMSPQDRTHLVITADLAVTIHDNFSASSRAFVFLPVHQRWWSVSLLLGPGVSAGRFGYSTWHDKRLFDGVVPTWSRVDRRELRVEAVAGLSFNLARSALETRELVVFALPYWVVAQEPVNDRASAVDFAHDHGGLLVLSGTFGGDPRSRAP